MAGWPLNLFRFACIAIMIYGAYGNRNPYFLELINSLYAGRFEFLTVLGLHLSILTILISMIESWLGNTNLSLLLIGVALPVEILITVLFWGLFLYNPALLISKKAIQAGMHIPLPLNVAQHLAPALFLSFEFAIISSKFRYSRTHIAAITAFSFSYFAWIHFLAAKNNRWVYPFINVLNNWQRGLLLLASWFICYLAYNLMHFISSSYHKAKVPSLRHKKSK